MVPGRPSRTASLVAVAASGRLARTARTNSAQPVADVLTEVALLGPVDDGVCSPCLRGSDHRGAWISRRRMEDAIASCNLGRSGAFCVPQSLSSSGCDQGRTGLWAAHEPGTLGCAACHLGNPFTLNKALAHAGMTLTPGNLFVVNRTCGASNCH